jgi:hypothetical protein
MSRDLLDGLVAALLVHPGDGLEPVLEGVNNGDDDVLGLLFRVPSELSLDELGADEMTEDGRDVGEANCQARWKV